MIKKQKNSNKKIKKREKKNNKKQIQEEIKKIDIYKCLIYITNNIIRKISKKKELTVQKKPIERLKKPKLF